MSPEDDIEARLEGLVVLNVRQIHLLQLLRPVPQAIEDLAKMSEARYGSVDSEYRNATYNFVAHTFHSIRRQTHLLSENPLRNGCVLLVSYDSKYTKPYPRCYYRVYDYSTFIPKEGLWWLKESYRPKTK